MEVNEVIYFCKPGLADPDVWTEGVVQHFWRIISFSQTSLDFWCEESHRNMYLKPQLLSIPLKHQFERQISLSSVAPSEFKIYINI